MGFYSLKLKLNYPKNRMEEPPKVLKEVALNRKQRGRNNAQEWREMHSRARGHGHTLNLLARAAQPCQVACDSPACSVFHLFARVWSFFAPFRSTCSVELINYKSK